MGTITERKRKDGSTAYLAQIVISRQGKIIHRENKTFDRRPAASAWLKRREKELATPEGVAAAGRDRRNPTLADAIDKYLTESTGKTGKTKAQVLRTIKTYDLASMACADIKSPDIVTFARDLRSTQQVAPQTAANYLSHLSAIFAIARPAWNYSLDPAALKDAFKVCNRLGLTGKGASRDRRPTLKELDRLMDYFLERNTRMANVQPMAHIIAFAIFSTRRQEEICRILHSDWRESESRYLVRDMKHPGEKAGNNVWCDAPAPLPGFIKALSKARNKGADDRLFPFNHRTVSSNFTRACHVLGIEDLTFHDLRHDGISRLFEMGLTIPHAAAVSGHRTWGSLQRYTHIRQSGDKYGDWPWLEILINAPFR